MRVPSGDQAGKYSALLVLVSRRTAASFTRTANTS